MYISCRGNMECKKFESLIGSYLKGTISENEREIFEEHYFLCSECFLSLKISESLFEKRVRILQKEEKWYSMIFKPAIVFASIILIAFSSLFVINQNKNNERLIKISEFSPPLYIGGENRGRSIPNAFFEAMKHYQAGEYGEANKIISGLEDGKPKVWFFSGILALIEGDNKNALGFFNLIIDKMDPSYYDEAVFYKGICFLRMKRKKDAILQFETLKTMYSHLSREASKRLELLYNL